MQVEPTGLSPVPSTRRSCDMAFQVGHSVLMWCVNSAAPCIGFILIANYPSIGCEPKRPESNRSLCTLTPNPLSRKSCEAPPS